MLVSVASAFSYADSDEPEGGDSTLLESGLYWVDYDGELIKYSGYINNAVQISCSNYGRIFVLKSDGTVECIQSENYESNYGYADEILKEISALRDIIQIGAYESHFVALDSSGKIHILGNFVTFADEYMDDVRKDVDSWPKMVSFRGGNLTLAASDGMGHIYHTQFLGEPTFTSSGNYWNMPDVVDYSISTIDLFGVTSSGKVKYFAPALEENSEVSLDYADKYNSYEGVVKALTFGEGSEGYFLLEDGYVLSGSEPVRYVGPGNVVDFDFNSTLLFLCSDGTAYYRNYDGETIKVGENVEMISSNGISTAMLIKNPCFPNVGYDYASAEIGDSVLFGTYEQDNEISNGTEPIEWIVTDKNELGMKLISMYCLDAKPYSTSYSASSWEDSYLRSWLNDEFFRTAFSDDEQKMILTTDVTADSNPAYRTKQGCDTKDRIFLLSASEADDLTASMTLCCSPTTYAKSQKALMCTESGYSENCSWWLRTIGHSLDSADYVNGTGEINYYGCMVNNKTLAVRPVIWIES